MPAFVQPASAPPALLGPRQLLPRPWAKLTDAQFAAVRPFLPGGDKAPWVKTRGRRPEDLRRTLDAIFWVACSRGPWKQLPAELGKADTASRALRRWAKLGVLAPLLLHATLPALAAPPVLQRLGYWIARAFRRMARLLPSSSLGMAKTILGLVDACPAWPLQLPDRNLSETARSNLATLNAALRQQVNAYRTSAQSPGQEAAGQQAAHLCEAALKAARAAIRAVRQGFRLLRLGVLGNRHAWRLH